MILKISTKQVRFLLFLIFLLCPNNSFIYAQMSKRNAYKAMNMLVNTICIT